MTLGARQRAILGELAEGPRLRRELVLAVSGPTTETRTYRVLKRLADLGLVMSRGPSAHKMELELTPAGYRVLKNHQRPR